MFQILKKILLDAKFQLPMKYINIFSYYILPISLGIYFLVLYFGSGDIYYAARGLGERTFQLLLLILFIKPLTQIFVDLKILTKILVLRRQLGVIIFWLFLFHGLGTLFALGLLNTQLFTYFTAWNSYLLWGFLAGIIIFFLGLTSNTCSVQLLKRNWKRLHMLVYPALLFVALHIYFIRGDIRPLFMFGVLIVLKVLVKKGFKIRIKNYFIKKP